MSSQTLPVSCILPNPDIAGIGVRSSIYVQSFLTTIMFFIFGLDNKITRKENLALHAVTVSTLMTACALLISSFIQAATIGMSAYHAQIVLNLSWINSTSLLHAAISELEVDERAASALQGGSSSSPAPSSSSSTSSSSSESGTGFLKSLFVGSLHFCAMSALGLWLWIKGGKFGSQPDCNNYTIYVLFGRDIPFTSKGLKIISLLIYALASIPILNTILFMAIMVLTALAVWAVLHIIARLFDDCFGSDLFDKFDLKETTLITVSSTVVAVFLNLVFIIDNELMIRRSAALVQPGESEWTFGQTLALVLLALPAMEIYKARRISTWEKDTATVEKPVATKEDPKDPEPIVETA